MSMPSLEELKPLDIRQCNSVADIVKSLKLTSFGARMLGEVTAQIYDWIQAGTPAIAIYDDSQNESLNNLLGDMLQRGWLANLQTSQQYLDQPQFSSPVLVLDTFSAPLGQLLAQHNQNSIFINSYGLAKPGQVSDGYFPNVIFADPNFILPIVFLTLQEYLESKKTNVVKLIEMLANYDGLAMQVHRGAQVLLAMIQDPDCAVFLTLSGAMTIAKMGLMICDMVDFGMVQAICSTGALMSHGFVENVGLKHFKYSPTQDDNYLSQNGMNRITDSLELDSNLDYIESIVVKLLEDYDANTPLSPRLFHDLLGQYLIHNYPGQRGILQSTYENKVPVFVPAFHDSEIGTYVFLHNSFRIRQGRPKVVFDQEIDTQYLIDQVLDAKKIGIFSIGGGVPRNYTQNVPPLIEFLFDRLQTKVNHKQFYYGCRICPDPSYYGHLSGCSYSEGISWKKMDPKGRFCEIQADATLVWPFLVKYVIEVLAK